MMGTALSVGIPLRIISSCKAAPEGSNDLFHIELSDDGVASAHQEFASMCEIMILT